MKLLSLSILIGLALIATAIYFKPTEPVLACSANGCGYLKGNYLFTVENGYDNGVKYHKRLNLNLSTYLREEIFPEIK